MNIVPLSPLFMRVRLLLTIMPKRARSSTVNSRSAPTKVELSTSSQNNGTPTKKTRQDTKFLPNKIATAENASKVDKDPPFLKLEGVSKACEKIKAPNGECVVYWMRMQDLRGNFSPRDYVIPKLMGIA